MKGSEQFRLSSQSYLQFQNEIYFYDNIVPYFTQYQIQKSKVFDFSEWLPKTYLSCYQIDEASSKVETILVQQNIQKIGFHLEQSLYLAEGHLNIMIECLAQFHALSLAAKTDNGTAFLAVTNGIQPLCFEQPNGVPSLYDVLHEISTTRFFDYVSTQKDLSHQFIADVNRLKEVVGHKPVKLLDRFRDVDDFSVIVHGDFHRNNLLFKMAGGSVTDMKMIDFQQIRYGSPCLDLSFFMYLNISAELRETFWNEILQQYHRKLVTNIATLLDIATNDDRLTCYRYIDYLIARIAPISFEILSLF